ncbi:ABC transporter substrate-binding protein [Rhodococcus sp. PAM 2766]|uniref:ABC transporter substrate-binding protein n=1 Tax=Rhodococcus parequi TaxID=3137122 RepID=A0ABW9FEG7_9NOCA
MAPNGNGRIRILAACLTAIPVVALTAACGVDTSSRTGGSVGSGPVVVGAADTIESELVARLYAGALGANGTATELVLGLGDQADRLAALDGNRVSLVPEHTGRLLHRFDSAAEVTEEEDVYDALSRSLPEGLSVSEYAPADDRSALVLTEEQADVLGASSVADLAPRCSTLTLYASEDFAADAGALDRLQSLYGCTFAEVVPAGSPAAGTRELAAGASPVHGTTAADSVVAQDELVVLTDEEGAFTAQNVVPLFRSGVLTADDIRSLSVILQLSTADLTAMAARVRDGELSSADAAAAWLEEHV